MANLPPNDDANALVPDFNDEFMPNPGHAHFANNNNNGWIEWDVPLGGMDEPMVDLEFDEEDDEDEVGGVVDAPNPSTYEVGGPSTAIVAQPQVIDDLYREVDNLRERQGALVRTIVEVSDIEATNSIAIRETHPRVTTLEEQVQTLQTALHESRTINQQLQTTVAEMQNREGTVIQYMLWMEERLTVLEKRLPRPPPEGHSPTRVAKALAAIDATRNATGAGGAGNAGGPERAQQARDSTFSSFMKCGPTQFHGKEGAIELCRWFEKMECTFGISECAKRNKVKFGFVLDPSKVAPSIKKKTSQYIKGLHQTIQGETNSSNADHYLNEANKENGARSYGAVKFQGWKEKNAEQETRENGKVGNLKEIIKAIMVPIEKQPDNHRDNQTITEGMGGHSARDCRGKGVATGANTEPIRVCYKCGDPNHLANSELCPEKKKLDGRNAGGHVYAVKNVDQAQGPNVVTVNHLFKIDLMPIELGTFDVIIGMDWLADNDAVIICGKKEVHIPIKNRTLVVKGDSNSSRLKVISCIKARKYIERGCHLFLAHVTEKEKSEKRLEDVPV
ncbi:putative reverse transcriptase domain-containing protein [Tanacetum coccineum]